MDANFQSQLANLILRVLAYSGSAAVLAFALFRFFGEKWIENRFAQRLSDLRHQQDIELQQLRIKIDATLRGVVALQEREFELLPKAWHLLDEAYGAVSWLTSPMQEHQDLDRFDSRQLDEYLEGTKLTSSQKDEVKRSSRKLQTYLDIAFRYNAQHVQSRTSELHNFVARNGVLFPEGLKEQFVSICHKLHSATIDKKIGYEAKDFALQGQGWKTLKDDVDPLYAAIEVAVRTRLRSHALMPAER